MALPIPKELTGLLDALHDGVTDLATSAAVSQLDHWHDVLADAAKPELKAVSKDIDALRKLLGEGGSPDGKKIGKALLKLADHIDSLDNTELVKGVKTRLHSLARLLRSEGEELTA